MATEVMDNGSGRTDAQRRAEARYRKKSVRTMTLRFYPADSGMYEYVHAHGGSTFVKSLIRERMGSE